MCVYIYIYIYIYTHTRLTLAGLRRRARQRAHAQGGAPRGRAEGAEGIMLYCVIICMVISIIKLLYINIGYHIISYDIR